MDSEVNHSNEAIGSMIDHPNVISLSKSEREVLALITPHTPLTRRKSSLVPREAQHRVTAKFRRTQIVSPGRSRKYCTYGSDHPLMTAVLGSRKDLIEISCIWFRVEARH